MSTTMRLKRMGSKKRPYYRIVVQDNRRASTSVTIVDQEKAKDWIKKGVTVSQTVKELLNKSGITLDRKAE